MSLLRDGRYELKGSRGLITGFQEALLEEFKQRGFELKLHVDRPGVPEVDELVRNDELVTVAYQSGELSVETESPFEELEEIIVSGAARFLARDAAVLFASFNQSQRRRALDSLDKGVAERLERPAPEA